MTTKQYDHDYIEHPATFKAVSFARRLIREGSKTVDDSIVCACGYYNVSADDVRYFVEQAAERTGETFGCSPPKETSVSWAKPIGTG